MTAEVVHVEEDSVIAEEEDSAIAEEAVTVEVAVASVAVVVAHLNSAEQAKASKEA